MNNSHAKLFVIISHGIDNNINNRRNPVIISNFKGILVSPSTFYFIRRLHDNIPSTQHPKTVSVFSPTLSTFSLPLFTFPLFFPRNKQPKTKEKNVAGDREIM